MAPAAGPARTCDCTDTVHSHPGSPAPRPDAGRVATSQRPGPSGAAARGRPGQTSAASSAVSLSRTCHPACRPAAFRPTARAKASGTAGQVRGRRVDVGSDGAGQMFLVNGGLWDLIPSIACSASMNIHGDSMQGGREFTAEKDAGKGCENLKMEPTSPSVRRTQNASAPSPTVSTVTNSFDSTCSS
jgi:hypothetical protein